MACVFNLIKSYSYFIIVNLQYSVLLVNKRAVRRQIELSPSLHHAHLHLFYTDPHFYFLRVHIPGEFHSIMLFELP